MPLPVPATDNRRYQALVDELVARVPSHTPEWTNFTESDPGVTLIQLFAHITESLLYRTNQIPERNRAKFIQLLGVPLAPAQEARGLAAFMNERAPKEALVIPRGAELFAGTIPFRTATSLDVLPLEAKYYVRRTIAAPSQEQQEYYALLYASYDKPAPQPLTLYETAEVVNGEGADLALTVDHSLWVALLGRKDDRQPVTPDNPDGWNAVREALGGRTLSLGLMPDQGAQQIVARPGTPPAATDGLLRFELPTPGPVALDGDGRPAPTYVRLDARADFDPLTQPGIVELTLPAAAGIDTWHNLDPLEAGVGDLPPMVDTPDVADRLVTWLRVRSGSTTDVKLWWVGINAAQIRQQLLIGAERLADGDATPDQARQLRQSPVLAGSVMVTSIDGGARHDWAEIDDLRAAGPELPIPGAPDMGDPVDVFSCDAEAGILRFGDGLTGRRPRLGEALYASYASTEGAEGNVAAGMVKGGPMLPAGVAATNPVPTWGGAEAESVAAAEKQVPRFVTHRDRLVTADDYRAIAWRTPGVALGRLEVLPAAHPDVAPLTIGSAPGAVTLMAVPARDPAHPDAPRADRPFLNALCTYLDPRRLVTTELVLRGPDYVGIWISIGIEIAGGRPVAETVEAVKTKIKAYLSPLAARGTPMPQLPMLYGPDIDPALRGWPLARPVHARALLAEAARTPGVVEVYDVLLAQGIKAGAESVELSGLELPEILGLSVVTGPPLSLDVQRGATGTPTPAAVGRMPVPVLAETC
jgi:predicted phage baseplate assembly protein